MVFCSTNPAWFLGNFHPERQIPGWFLRYSHARRSIPGWLFVKNHPKNTSWDFETFSCDVLQAVIYNVDDSGCVSSEGDDCCDEEEGGEGNVKADVCGSAGCACGDCGRLASMCLGEIDKCDKESGAGKETQG